MIGSAPLLAITVQKKPSEKQIIIAVVRVLISDSDLWDLVARLVTSMADDWTVGVVYLPMPRDKMEPLE